MYFGSLNFEKFLAEAARHAGALTENHRRNTAEVIQGYVAGVIRAALPALKACGMSQGEISTWLLKLSYGDD
jgi:hypothetical protein